MLSVGREKAAKIFTQLSSNEIEKLTVAISQINMIEPAVKDRVLREFYLELNKVRGGVSGGDSTIKELLEMGLGKNEAKEYLSRLNIENKAEADIYQFLKTVDTNQLSNFLYSEQPQTIALVLSYLDAGQAAQILATFGKEQQSEIMLRLGTMSDTDPDIVAEVGSVVKNQLSASLGHQLKAAGGVKSVAEIINHLDRESEKSIMEFFETSNKPLADDVRKLMFTFEDILLVEDRSMQRVLKEVDTSELSLALKSASEAVKNKVFGNISKRAAELIQEEIEYMGPVRLKDVEDAQQRIVNIVRRLEEEGEVVITGRGGAGEKFV